MFVSLLLATLLTWGDFFGRVTPRGAEFTARMRALEGSRVHLRGYSITTPPIEGGVLLSRLPYDDPHEVDETDVPFDAVAVIWRKGVELGPIPRRPTVEGTLRLGTREHSGQMTAISLEDAIPVVNPAR